MSGGLKKVEEWFAARGREPFRFQREAWEAYARGESGLIQAPTGMGKTLAAGLGCVIDAIDRGETKKDTPFTLLWITPLRALAGDTVLSLAEAIEELGLKWTVQLRTSDTSASVRKKQKDKLPTVLVTTPESLSLLMSYEDSVEKLKSVRCVVADEWHELMGTKRGVQAELGIARLKKINPQLRVWGVSATVANVEEALATLVGVRGNWCAEAHPAQARNLAGCASAHHFSARIIRGEDTKVIEVKSLFPKTIERFPWAGHLGTAMTDAVVEQIEKAKTTLIFTNTRSQTELWFRALIAARPDWMTEIAVHHGSVDRKIRAQVEAMLKEGSLKAVVCTSSMDLGVDFWPVEQVIQIGSPKGIGRAMQRAGRSGHRPGVASRLTCVPTQAFELIEFSATRLAIERRGIESREPVVLPLDVLAQHVITIAAGGGFNEEELFEEVRATYAFKDLTREHWQWTMDFAHHGGPTLTAYPRFARIVKDDSGKWKIASDSTGRMHRMQIGTITSDGAVMVQFVNGRYLGTVEESFVAKLRKGDTFIFAGRVLEFVRIHEMAAQVKVGKSKKATVPRWAGGRLPMSSALASAVRERLDEASRGDYVDAEMQQVKPILAIQERWSRIPRRGEILIEKSKSREGWHHYLFPFQGRLAHEGLAAILAYRFGEKGLKPITATFNDYGIELLSPHELATQEREWMEVLKVERLSEDVLACLNTGELAKRHFREIARIAGLLVTQRPGAPKSARAMQASSGLFYDVFVEFDPQNLLLEQARREVLERQLEMRRLRTALEQIHQQDFMIVECERISPLAFPLFAERIASQQLRSESASERIARVAEQLEKAAQWEEEEVEVK